MYLECIVSVSRVYCECIVSVLIVYCKSKTVKGVSDFHL